GDVLNTVSRKYDLAGRFGGDEFILLLPGADVEHAIRIAQRVQNAFANAADELLSQQCDDMRVTMSMGLTWVEAGTPISADQLIAQADRALYRAKINPATALVVEPAVTRTHE